ncbi:efflux transporter outer membrane subunit [Corticibacter populi]|uniref:Efflux transporter outer membrane subunit n=1 Tax=Corticibacter populi TaxID=1550736 RepID=A0A3M6QTK4_9BURK|nr:efflux transporter outer membrane subunit [Corticibacter populi]RMX06360.1 efflux transporter outer membrane subunit [Corticibacter populi]RZS32097.1 NodT family efflux transporter outer membrane factor (OMF) lipoprotein [Corticibacter populi]
MSTRFAPRPAVPPATPPTIGRRLPAAWSCALAVLLAACAATPPHPAPELALPGHYLHQQGWQTATPAAVAAAQRQGSEATDGPAAWWQVYQDAALDAVLAEVTLRNATLEQAAAQWRQAEAAVAAARASRYPQLDGTASANRSGSSGRSASADGAPQSRFAAGLSASWMPDVWGRLALGQQAAQASADAAAAELAAVRLALQLSAAEQYVSLRRLELDARLLAQTRTAYQRSLLLTRNQYDSGFVARADVIQAQIQLESVQAQIAANQHQQALARNALALLAGSTPGQWQAPGSHDVPLQEPPAIPARIVSALLLQRPDIAAAAGQLAAANAQLGLAQTAWLPDLSLSASAGLQASRWSDFIDAPLRVWSLGPALAASLFDGGARRAATAQAEAAYQARAAAWRASVLQAVQEVEDALAAAQWLQAQHTHQLTLLQLADENLRVVQNQYEAGLVSYLDVATAQNLALGSQRNALDLQAQRLQASMQLIAALGGGWQVPRTASIHP